MSPRQHTRIAGLALLAGLASAVPSMAQSLLPASPSLAAPDSSTSPTVVPDYKIAPGDVLSVTVADWPSNSVPATAVTPDGKASLPMLHQVPVSGLTVSQATDLITKNWRKYLVDPVVTVALVQKHQQIIVFAGSVARPGAVEYRSDMHLIEALAEVGGFVVAGSPSTGSVTTVGLQTTISDPSHVTITHTGGTKQVLNLTHPDQLAGTDTDIALEPGDVIYVPQQLGKINMVGEVHNPGVIPYRENLTVFDAISDSGGYNSETADLVNASLVHNGVAKPLNLDPLLRHGINTANVVLAPGDQITIPELKNKTFVYGDVARPGAYPYKPGDRIAEALSAVNGPLGQADLGKINIIHKDKVHGTMQMVRVNFNDFLLNGKDSGNPVIQSGDTLYIPDKHHTFSPQDILNAASGIGSLAYTRQILQHP